MDRSLFKQRFDRWCQRLSLLITFGETFIALLSTWVIAYMNPSKSVLVTINNMNEAVPELIMWIIITPICVYGLYLNLKYLKDCQII
jgi:succinate dehydrogenase/fumarate reductase cytochrome b subunit